MEISKLYKLLKNEEGTKLDFKEKLNIENDSDKKEFAKDVIAIANSKGGRGYIIYGIKDKTKEIIGINSECYNEEQLQQIIYHRCDPPIPIKVECMSEDDKNIVIITIYGNSNKPHMMIQTGAFYIRRGSTTGLARRNEIASLLQEYGILSYETVVLNEVDDNQLDMQLIKKYFSKLGAEIENPNKLLLESLGIIGKDFRYDNYFVTIGGLLLFGNNPALFLPHVNIKIVNGNDINIFTGNILKMMDDTSKYLEENIKIKNYPVFAVEEAIANAIVHRDYLDNSREILIIITETNIEVINPGALISGNTVYRYERENHPERRNPWLYQRVLILDDKNRFMKAGIGIKRIKKAYKDFGNVKFVNLERDNLFKVILPL